MQRDLDARDNVGYYRLLTLTPVTGQCGGVPCSARCVRSACRAGGDGVFVGTRLFTIGTYVNTLGEAILHNRLRSQLVLRD